MRHATVPIEDPRSGEVRQAQIFVAVLGASSYTYAEATSTQQLPDWLGSHVRAFELFSGAPEIVVPDNLRAGVTQACRYEPDLNRSYQDLATHYSVAVVPARPRKPRDKAKVEQGVQVAERWAVAALRKRRFRSLGELNHPQPDSRVTLGAPASTALSARSNRDRQELLGLRPGAESLPRRLHRPLYARLSVVS